MSSLMIVKDDVSMDGRPRLSLTLIGADRIAFMRKLLHRATNTHWEELSAEEKRFVDEACGALNQEAGVEALKLRGMTNCIAVWDDSPFARTTDSATGLGVSLVKEGEHSIVETPPIPAA